MDQTNQSLEACVKGKLIWLLALIILVQFSYPMTAYGTFFLVVYQIIYASMIVVGIVVSRDSRLHMGLLILTGIAYLSIGLIYALNPTVLWLIQITYLVIIPYLVILLWVLGRFLIIVKTITRDVIYAAIALYLLIGAVFVPVYGLLESFNPGSFIDSGYPDAPVQWQQFIYYSYTTLSSTGYGDILPLSWWARAFANLEMVAGGLFITIVMARLVALYSETGDNS